MGLFLKPISISMEKVGQLFGILQKLSEITISLGGLNPKELAFARFSGIFLRYGLEEEAQITLSVIKEINKSIAPYLLSRY